MNNQAIKIFLNLLITITSFSAMTASIENNDHWKADILRRDEFTTYINLKNNIYDFSVINNVDYFLAESWPSTHKPIQCPLIQTDEQELVDKLNQIIRALKNSSCSNDKDSYFARFDASVTKIGQFYHSGSTINNTLPTVNPQVGYYQNMNDMIGSLSNFSSDPKCAFDIKERGLIPVLSDIIGSASVSALFIPNKYSLVAGTAGIAASASLKIIDGLLRPKFNMDNNDDRESFIRLVCIFYEVRAQIEHQKFLHSATVRDEAHYQTARAFSMSIDSKLGILEARKKQALNSLDEIKEAYVATKLSPEKIKFLKELPQLKFKLSSKDTSSSWRFRSQLPSLLQEIAHHLETLNLENSHYALFADIESDKNILSQSIDSLLTPLFIQQSDEEISTYFMKPLLRFEEIVLADRTRHEEDFDRTIIFDNLNGSDIKAAILTAFDSKIEHLKVANNKINNYLLNIKKILDKQDFVDNDQGTHIDHLIIRFIKDIESQLYGHVGWRFHEYMRNNAAKELRKFFTYYIKFNHHFLNPITIIERESLRRTACATASDIILTINNAKSLVNMGTDYIFTNRDFFHNNIPLIDVHLKLIPTGWSIQRQFLLQAHALIKAQEYLKTTRNPDFPKILRHRNILSVPNIGDLILGQIYADNMLDRLYEFKTLNHCDG